MNSAAPSRSLGEGSRWYAVQTRPRGESLALRHLQNQGFEAYCPRLRRIRAIGRNKVTTLDPFFPGYLFVSIDLERQRWRSVNGTIGVLRLVGFGNGESGRPSPVPPGLVERIRELSDGDELRFKERLCRGDAVRVTAGPFAELCGVLETAGSHERVTILLDILSKSTRVTISRDMLIAA
jgi:transcription elongation factor/antiterminator RfaH